MGRPRTRAETCVTITCLPPWFMLWRWLNGGGSNSKTGSKDRAASSSGNVNFSDSGKEVLFNLGVDLIYLIRDELNKMVELRQNIKSLLEEHRNQDTKSLSGSGISSFASNSNKTEENDRGERLATRFSSSRRYRRERSLRMDQLEAELEAEFDRLQITSDSFKYSKYSEVNMEDSAPDREGDESGTQDEFYGVSPKELERKLQEVLETRQQERIVELESALDYAMQQLEKRERELARLKQDRVRCVDPEFESMKAGKSVVKID